MNPLELLRVQLSYNLKKFRYVSSVLHIYNTIKSNKNYKHYTASSAYDVTSQGETSIFKTMTTPDCKGAEKTLCHK